MSRTHVLLLPLPAQGHVNPLMELSHELTKHGIKIKFVIIDNMHKRIMEVQAARSEAKEQVGSDQIKLVSIPDGLEQEKNQARSVDRLMESMWRVMPEKLEKMIQEINEELENEKVGCIVADKAMGWALEVAEKMGIAVFFPASASLLTLLLSIPKLLLDGIIDSDGMRPFAIHYLLTHFGISIRKW